jgi:hypothetical protein
VARHRWRLVGLVTAVVLLALAGTAAAAAFIRWNGGLGYGYGNGIGVPVRVGEPFSIGMTAVQPERDVRIEAVRLHDPRGRVRLVGVGVLPPGSPGVGSDRGFPPEHVPVKLRPAVGAVIPANAESQLVVGLRATARGTFSVRGVDVLYRVRWHGLELRRKAHVGVEVQGCAVTTSTGIPKCTLPKFSSDSAG